MSINFHPDSFNVSFCNSFFAMSLLPKNYCYYIFYGNSNKYMKTNSVLLLYIQERDIQTTALEKNPSVQSPPNTASSENTP